MSVPAPASRSAAGRATRLGAWACLAASAVLLAGPRGAEAQFFDPIEGLFDRVDGFTISGTVGGLVSSSELDTDAFLGIDALRGMAIEVLIDLTARPAASDSGQGTGEQGASADGAGATDGADPAGEVEGEDGQPAEPAAWGLELGLGADYLTGFVARDPGLDLRGSMRGLPNLSAYASPPVAWGVFQPYLGLGVGFVQLWNVQGYDAEGRQYDLAGDTFQLGAMAGLYHDSGFFLEAAYRNRNFRSVRWGLPSGVEAVPAGWPRALDLSALLVSVGYQFGRLVR